MCFTLKSGKTSIYLQTFQYSLLRNTREFIVWPIQYVLEVLYS